MKEYDYDEHYDDAIKWTIQEVITALKNMNPSDLSHYQWGDIYFTIKGKDFEEAYQAYLESFFDINDVDIDPSDVGMDS
jgi:hypothetical protein